MRVAIFGAGPAGLLVAHAARRHGVEFDIFSYGPPSRLYGAQYLHEEILDIPFIPSQKITHEFRGTVEGYRNKVYGLSWRGEVSPEQFDGETEAWDIRYAYQWLVKEYWGQVLNCKIELPGVIHLLQSMNRVYDLVISTIPRNQICLSPQIHKFSSAMIWAIGDAPDLGRMNPIQIPQNTLVCDGNYYVSWYRSCNIFGHSTTEWSFKRKPPIEGVAKVSKPLTTDCTCFEDRIVFLGRYGEWKKGVLTHHVFQTAEKMFQDRKEGS